MHSSYPLASRNDRRESLGHRWRMLNSRSSEWRKPKSEIMRSTRRKRQACRYAFQLWPPRARVETCDLQVKLIITDDRCERNGRRDELLRATLKRRSYQFSPITPTWQSPALNFRGNSRDIITDMNREGRSESSTPYGMKWRMSIPLFYRAHRVIFTGNHIVLNLVGIFKGKRHMCYLHFTGQPSLCRGIYLKRLRSVA